jgi:hypothetical protein
VRGAGGGTGAGGPTGRGGTTGSAGNGGTTGTGGTAGTAGTTGSGGSTGGAAGRGGATGTGGAAGRGGAPGRGGTTGAGGNNGDTARYNFEGSTQDWEGRVDSELTAFASVATSASQRFAGASSLAGMIDSTAGAKYALEVSSLASGPRPGSVVTFHVYVPNGATVDWIQPYVVDAGSVFTGYYLMSPRTGAWTTITVTVPSNAMAIDRLGVQFHTTGAWSGTVNVDSVNW